jgi:HD superfamily phosphodiesterase
MARTLPGRWRHVEGVAALAAQLSTGLDGVESELVAAAWLHDIGYSPNLVVTKFHPLDGARFLRARGFSDPVACLVAHHSFARMEADLRGLGDVLNAEFVQGSRNTSWPCERSGGDATRESRSSL